MTHRRSSNPLTEALEPRRLFAAAYPSNLEQYLVELINRGRANPAAEAARYNVGLNEGLAAGTISTAAKQPLAINPYLTDGARGHGQWMLAHNTFSHTGAGGSNPGARMSAAGYAFVPPWTWGENIAWQSSDGSAATASLVATLHKNLFVDAGIADRGHRTNLMSGAFREIGAGYVTGAFSGYANAGMLTTDFTSTAGNAFFTGVAYRDTVTADHFYTPGEGLGGVTVTATRLVDGATFATTTWASGGYSLQVPAGTYQVSAAGGALAQPVTFSSVAIGAQNVKEDFVPSAAPPVVVTPPTPDTTRPTAALTQALRRRTAGKFHSFVVTFSDNAAINPATLDNLDVRVTGPRGFTRYAIFSSINLTTKGSPRTATYKVKGPGAGWDAADNGTYTIWLQASQVADATGNTAQAKSLGTFKVIIPAPTVPAILTTTTRPAPSRGGDPDNDDDLRALLDS